MHGLGASRRVALAFIPCLGLTELFQDVTEAREAGDGKLDADEEQSQSYPDLVSNLGETPPESEDACETGEVEEDLVASGEVVPQGFDHVDSLQT